MLLEAGRRRTRDTPAAVQNIRRLLVSPHPLFDPLREGIVDLRLGEWGWRVALMVGAVVDSVVPQCDAGEDLFRLDPRVDQ